MSYAWELSIEAKDAVERQLEWYESNERNGGVEMADRWLERLEKVLIKLALAPMRHALAPENGRWHPTVEIGRWLACALHH